MKSKWQLAVLLASVGVALIWAVSSLQRGAPVAGPSAEPELMHPGGASLSLSAKAMIGHGAPAGAKSAPSSHDLQQLQVLDEILAAKNDNDPRMDSELRYLSPEAKRLMRERYRSLPPEKRNQRGTIAFLIGRDLSSPEDVAFLSEVVSEPPCLSLSDCAREDKPVSGMDHDIGDSVTLAYPQMAVLGTLEQRISRAEQGSKIDELAGIRRVIDQASRSPVPIVATKARSLLDRMGRLDI